MDSRLDMTRRDLVRFSVPGAPVPKGRPKARVTNGFAQIYTPHKTRQYEAKVKRAAMDAMKGLLPVDGPVAVTLIAYFPIAASTTKRDRALIEAGHKACMALADLDNVVKSVTDALNEVVYADDRQIIELNARKLWSDSPRVLLKIETLHAADLVAAAQEQTG